MDILWLGHPSCHDLGLVGGKVANLSRLAADYRVPPGFCLTTNAFHRYATDGRGGVEGLPPPLGESLSMAYGVLGDRTGIADPSVAVRSSAVDEDGLTASFAGQHETYLNVVGEEAIAEAVVRCWMSACATRVVEYRRQQGLTDNGVRLAVLVQQLIAADVSAVVFSANPVTDCRDEILINASWGLGESIVGGTVTPDTFVVRKSDLEVVQRRVTEKQRMTVPLPRGTREVGVPRFLRTQPSLDDAQVAEMARLAVALEERMGWPVDVECAYQAGQLHLLQCRPITTLSSASREAEHD